MENLRAIDGMLKTKKILKVKRKVIQLRGKKSGREWCSDSCPLCKKLKNEGGTVQWFPDEA